MVFFYNGEFVREKHERATVPLQKVTATLSGCYTASSCIERLTPLHWPLHMFFFTIAASSRYYKFIVGKVSAVKGVGSRAHDATWPFLALSIG